MRPLPGLIASLCLALVAVAPASAATPKAKPNCVKKHSKTVVQAPGVRLYTARRVEEQVTVLFGCLTANGHRQELSERSVSYYDGTSTGFYDVRLAGRYVAWHFYDFDGSCKADCPDNYDQSKESVVVYDLRRERIVRRSLLPDFTQYTDGSLALTQRAGTAWLTAGTPGPQQLVVLDRDGRRVLDSGDIAPASVRAEISIVSWVRDGLERFARLR